MEGRNQLFLTVLLSAGSAALVVLLSLNLFRSGEEQLEERMVKVHDPYIPGLCYGSGLTESEYQNQYPSESWNVLDQEYVFEPSGFGGTCRMSKIKLRQKSRQQIASLKRESQERDREQARVKREQDKEERQLQRKKEARKRQLAAEKVERLKKYDAWKKKEDAKQKAKEDAENQLAALLASESDLSDDGRDDYAQRKCYGTDKFENIANCLALEVPGQGVRAFKFEYVVEGKKLNKMAGDPSKPNFPSAVNLSASGWKQVYPSDRLFVGANEKSSCFKFTFDGGSPPIVCID